MNKVDYHKHLCDELHGMYVKKNQDYGDSFAKSFEEYGMTMPLIRLEDKLNRLKSLVKSGKANYESIEDTLMDLANYSLLTVMEVTSEKSEATDTSNIPNWCDDDELIHNSSYSN